MDKEMFHKIIDFAIRREKEAISFYRSLQDLVHFSSQKEALKLLEEKEISHMKILRKMRSKGLKAVKVKNVADLMIGDALVEEPPSPDMSYQDILIMAMKKEEKAFKIYLQLAESSEDPEVRRVFEGLAAEEAEHKLIFETIYDSEILTQD